MMLTTTPTHPTPTEVVRQIHALRSAMALSLDRLAAAVDDDERTEAERCIELGTWEIAVLEQSLTESQLEAR